MSKSLNINAPQIVQTRNTLNAVPSGSTAEPDYNVKFVPQELTEEQKAQARQNIGAAAEGEGGGATINEFHYLRDTTTDPATYYIDADGYEPQEGDLMTIVWDWPFRTDENDEAAFKNPATLKNNSTNPSIYIKNAHQNATDYDEIDPQVNTRWTVRLEKVNDVWYAYNISTAVQADWNTLDTNAPSYIKNKPTIPAAQVQADWNQSDDTAVDYIKNKPNISGPDFSVVEDMQGSLTFYSNAYGQSVQFNNGSYKQLLADTVITDGVYHSYPNKTHSFGLSGKTTIHIPLVPSLRTHTGYFRFYPSGTFDYVWLHTSRNWNVISNNMILAEPFYQDIMCKDANIVINFGKTQQWSLYKINHTTSQNIQKFTVWTVNNTLWKEIWTGTGDVVMFDTDAYFKNDAEAPASLIGFTLYLPKNRYSSIVAQLKSDFGDSAVENYILPKVVQYDFICSEDYKYRMITLPTV